jgi:uncharacterized protein (DUF58 family)
MPTTGEQFLDPAILARIDNYSLIARTVVEGFVAGLHRSLFHGFGSEFVHYRNYAKGDDLKYVDWKVFARLDRYQTKVFQEETNAHCYLVLDTSGSMGYQGERSALSKLHYGQIMAACLAYLANLQGDNGGFFAYNDQMRAAVSPSHKSGQVHQIHVALAQLRAAGACDHRKMLHYLGEHFNRRGIVIVISDFLDADEEVRKAFRRFRAAHHEVVLFQVLDGDELDFDFTGTVRFVDSEVEQELVTSPEIVREQYRRALTAYLDEFSAFCVSADLELTRVRTTQSLATVLAAYLHRREMLRR